MLTKAFLQSHAQYNTNQGTLSTFPVSLQMYSRPSCDVLSDHHLFNTAQIGSIPLLSATNLGGPGRTGVEHGGHFVGSALWGVGTLGAPSCLRLEVCQGVLLDVSTCAFVSSRGFC